MTLYFQFLMVPTLPVVRSCGGSDRRLDGPIHAISSLLWVVCGALGLAVVLSRDRIHL